MGDISEEFFKFCVSYSCREKDRSDYCPIAERVKEEHGVIHGGEECERIWRITHKDE